MIGSARPRARSISSRANSAGADGARDAAPRADGARPIASGPVVVKLGGRALEGPDAMRELARDLAVVEGGAVLIHGGGAEVSAWCDRLGIEPSFARGRRVTDDRTLEVAVAVLAGLANKRLVAALRDGGLDAVGLAALDGIACAVPHADAAELGEVGEIWCVAPALLRLLLAAGRVPVLASIAAHGARLLNVNADDLAGAVAAGIGARALVLLSDVPGVSLDGRIAAKLGREQLESALAGPDVTGGMIPKLSAARAALDGGVPRVCITAWEGQGTLTSALRGRGAGTRIVNDPKCCGEVAAGVSAAGPDAADEERHA